MYTETGTWLSHISWFKCSAISCQCSDHKHSPIREPSLSPQGNPSSGREMKPGDGALIQAWARTLEDSHAAGNGGPERENSSDVEWGQSGMASWRAEVTFEPGFGLGGMRKETEDIPNRDQR